MKPNPGGACVKERQLQYITFSRKCKYIQEVVSDRMIYLLLCQYLVVTGREDMHFLLGFHKEFEWLYRNVDIDQFVNCQSQKLAPLAKVINRAIGNSI